MSPYPKNFGSPTVSIFRFLRSHIGSLYSRFRASFYGTCSASIYDNPSYLGPWGQSHRKFRKFQLHLPPGTNLKIEEGADSKWAKPPKNFEISHKLARGGAQDPSVWTTCHLGGGYLAGAYT